jgi:hypothetical protein
MTMTLVVVVAAWLTTMVFVSFLGATAKRADAVAARVHRRQLAPGGALSSSGPDKRH